MTRLVPMPTSEHRLETLDAHRRAVERVILVMQDRMHEPLTVRTLARTVHFSAYHFHRLFRRVAGIPPSKFLMLLRMEAAKEMLLTSPSRVTRVCMDVGYSSLGTFSTHFARLVGVSPRAFRQLAEPLAARYPEWLGTYLAWQRPDPRGAAVRGRVWGAPPGSTVFVGLFKTPVMQGWPEGFDFTTCPGTFRIPPVAPGRYHLMAAAFQGGRSPAARILPDDSACVSAARSSPVVATGEMAGPAAEADLALAPRQIFDPPVLTLFHLLLTPWHRGVLGPEAAEITARAG